MVKQITKGGGPKELPIQRVVRRFQEKPGEDTPESMEKLRKGVLRHYDPNAPTGVVRAVDDALLAVIGRHDDISAAPTERELDEGHDMYRKALAIANHLIDKSPLNETRQRAIGWRGKNTRLAF